MPARAAKGQCEGRQGRQVAAQPTPDSTTLTGRLDKFHDHKWSVHVAGKTMQIELAHDAKIKVALSNGKLISVGDKVSVQGKMVHGKSGKCLADELKVTLVKPLTAASLKPKSASPAVKKPDVDVDDDDDALTPDADSPAENGQVRREGLWVLSLYVALESTDAISRSSISSCSCWPLP